MKRTSPPYMHVDDLLREFAGRKDAIRQRLMGFAAVSADDYFYELVYCLLTPQSSAINAGRAVESLRAADFFGSTIQPAPLLARPDCYIRFHNMKAAYLCEAKTRFPEISAQLANGLTSAQLRQWLARNVKGLGWKEASHFLRNIGHRDLAILDRHILRNLKRHSVIRTMPKSLTLKRYLAIESKFARFAERIGISMDELDLLFWSRETGQILK